MARLDWKSLIGSVAPTIATALGGPLAGTAVNAVSQAVLGKPNGTQAEIAEVLTKSGNPEVLEKLKEAEMQYATKMKELGVDVEKIGVKDRMGARLREVALKDMTPKVLALSYTVGYFIILYYLWREGVPHFDEFPNYNAKDLISTLLGVLSAAQMAIITYYFGSSASSAQKSEMLEKLTKR
jgi:hypothetical protein